MRWTAGQADVSIRGGVQANDPRLLVLVNGRQVYLDHYGMTNWAGIGVQLEDIQQIEVVRGPNSALFGFNAVSGVINIITIDPLHKQQLVTTLEAGERGYLHLSQSAAITLREGLGLRLSGGLERVDELAGLAASPLSSTVSNDPLNPRQAEGAAELYARVGDRTDGSISGTYSSSKHYELTAPRITVPVHYTFGSLGAHVAHDTGWGVVSARVLRNWSSVDIANLLVGKIDLRNRVFIASGDALVRFGVSDTVRVGLEYRRNDMAVAPGYPGTIGYNVLAGSTMWEHRLNAAMTATAAARIDHLTLALDGAVDQPTIFTKANFDRSFTTLSLNGALLYKLNDQTSFRFAASRGTQAPSLFSLAGRIGATYPGIPFPVVIAGNPALRPAQISSAEIGLIRTLTQIPGRLEVTAFYNRTTDISSLTAGGTPPRAAPPEYPFALFAADNVGNFTAYGIEASLSGRFAPRWQWALNYSWTKTHQDIAGNSGDNFVWPLALDRATPLHKIKAQLSYENGPLLATVAARYTSPIQQLVSHDPSGNGALSLFEVSSSLALDGKLALKVNDTATFTLAGENLTNAGSVDLSPARAERRLRAGVRVSF